MRALLAVLLVGVLAPPAAADPGAPTLDEAFPPTLRISGDVLDVKLEVHSAPSVTWIAIDVGHGHAIVTDGGVSDEPRPLAIDLPEDAKVVTVITNQGHAVALDWRVALDRVRDGSHPTLTMWAGASSGEQHITLDTHERDHVEIGVALQPTARLRVDVGAKATLAASIDDVAVAHPRDLDLHAIAPPSPAMDLPVLDATTWFVSDDPSRGMPTIHFGDEHLAWHDSFGKGDIRRTVKVHTNQLRYCYESQLLSHPHLQGTATLVFFIQATGTIASVRVDGEMPDVVNRCLADEVASWEFPENEVNTEVHYPLTFKVALE